MFTTTLGDWHYYYAHSADEHNWSWAAADHISREWQIQDSRTDCLLTMTSCLICLAGVTTGELFCFWFLQCYWHSIIIVNNKFKQVAGRK